MPTRSSYSQGTPSWVDLQTSDVDGAKAFYGTLFGWTYDDQAIPEGGSYSIALKNGQTAAGLTQQPQDMAARGIPVMWNTYIAVDNVDAATKAASEAGGQIAMPAMDVMDAGRMAFVLDPSGAAIGMWQAGQHIGAGIVNEPGALIWNELITDNNAAAFPFYAKVFGMDTTEMPMEGMGSYTIFSAKGEQVAGSMAPPMEGVPNHWGVYFCVANVDDSVKQATSLGAEVVNGPFDTPIGKICVIRDPQGAYLSLFTPAGPTK